MNYTPESKTDIKIGFEWKNSHAGSGIQIYIKPTWSIYSKRNITQVKGLLAHEYNHVVYRLSLDKMRPPPTWVIEGLAMYNQNMVFGKNLSSLGARRLVKDLIERNKSIKPGSGSSAFVSYYVLGQTAFQYVSENYTQREFDILIEELKEFDTNFTESFKNSLGVTYDKFIERWYRWVKNCYTKGVEGYPEVQAKKIGGITYLRGWPTSTLKNGLLFAGASSSYGVQTTSSFRLNISKDEKEEFNPSKIKNFYSSNSKVNPVYSPKRGEIVLEAYGDFPVTSQLKLYEESNLSSEEYSLKTTLTEGGHKDVSPAWRPDGKRIAFVSDRSGDYDIYSVDVKGQDRKKIASTQYDEGCPTYVNKSSIVFFIE